MAIKVNLEKTYDKLRWDFIHDTLISTNFLIDFVHIVMDFITSPIISVFWNDKPKQEFKRSQVI